MRKTSLFGLLIYVLPVILLNFGCSGNSSTSPSEPADRLKVVATTTFVGDVVGRIAGNAVDLTVLLESGQNPHSYQPTPKDMVNVSDADLIFVNGLGLEDFLDDMLAGTGNDDAVIVVSAGIKSLEEPGQDHQHDGDPEGEDDQVDPGQNPHVWFDPNNIIFWTESITSVLVEKDPDMADFYLDNAAAYRNELKVLDNWIKDQVANIPLENRELVTDHLVFGYFVERYGFDQIGAIIPTYTTEAKTSGQQLADLIDIIREHDIKAIFIGVDFDPTLSQMVAEDTGVELVQLYYGSLSAGPPADTYLNFMYFNVESIVNALQ